MPTFDSTRPLPDTSTPLDPAPLKKLHVMCKCPVCFMQWELNVLVSQWDSLHHFHCVRCCAMHRKSRVITAFWPFVGMVGSQFDGRV